MASDSGGRAFFNNNSLSVAVTTALKETSTYYLLAWRPDNDEQRNAKFRRLEVSVAGRPDLIVRFRAALANQPTRQQNATRIQRNFRPKDTAGGTQRGFARGLSAASLAGFDCADIS
jgi:hypothetical protein